MRIKVMKFGGTSVATNESRQAAAQKVIQAKEQGFKPVVVVSAIGRRGAPYATDTLLNELREVDPGVTPDAREMDLLLACGEILSAVIFGHTLKSLGHSARAFRGEQAGIRTDSVFGAARIVSINPVNLVRAIEQGHIPVVCGFQGVYQPSESSSGGEVTTLGRGGSDTTGSAIGAALKAEAVEIYTDVDGVKTADPDAVPHAPTLPKVTYDELAEIAHLGAKVVHPRAAEIAMQKGIPLWVKNTFSEDPGTVIVSREEHPGQRVTGVTHTGKLVYLQFDLGGARQEDRLALESHLYETMARYDVNLHMLNLSPASTGFAVPREQYGVVKDVLDGLVVPFGGDNRVVYVFQIGETSREVETQVKLLEPLGEVSRVVGQLTEGCTMVSLVGHDYLQQPGVYWNVLSTLHQESVTVLQTSDSDFSLSVLIPEAETKRTVRLLHDKFLQVQRETPHVNSY